MSIHTWTNGQGHLEKIKLKKRAMMQSWIETLNLTQVGGFPFPRMVLSFFRVPCSRAINPK